jgi:hypothetical protein
LPEDDGEVLILEIDGKAAPTATEQELKRRRGPRSHHSRGCACRFRGVEPSGAQRATSKVRFFRFGARSRRNSR